MTGNFAAMGKVEILLFLDFQFWGNLLASTWIFYNFLLLYTRRYLVIVVKELSRIRLDRDFFFFSNFIYWRFRGFLTIFSISF